MNTPVRAQPVALVTGASAGLGRSLAHALARRGHRLVLDARGAEALGRVRAELAEFTHVVAIAGDVTDPGHRAELARAIDAEGRLDLLVHNASALGDPLRPLAELGADEFARLLSTNTIAPLALTRLLLPRLAAARGTVVTVSSDAAVEHYETWGGYGATKAALDHLAGTLAAERPELRWYAVDPGDMRTDMHARAFPGEDISDRPDPDEVAVPAVLRLLDGDAPSGRYRAVDVVSSEAIGASA